MARSWRTFMFGTLVWQPLTDLWAHTTRWPIIGKYLRYMLNEKHYDVTFIPINQELEQAEGTVIPRNIVEDMIRRSAHRVIMPLCLCRAGCNCRDYPIGIGCIFLGEGTKDINPELAISVSVEEALAHADRAIAAGLIPQIGRVDPDPLMSGVKIKNWDRFLTLCFCCTCCCIAMRNMPRWSPKVKDRMHRLEGLTLEVTAQCNGCGKCADSCFASAIAIKGQQAHIDNALCKGCGICAGICPQQAIKIEVNDGNKMLNAIFKRLESYADIT